MIMRIYLKSFSLKFGEEHAMIDAYHNRRQKNMGLWRSWERA